MIPSSAKITPNTVKDRITGSSLLKSLRERRANYKQQQGLVAGT